MSGEDHHHHHAPNPLDPALRHLARLCRKPGSRTYRTSASPPLPSMQNLEPRLLMAGDVVYALNAGGSGFTDTNGVQWIADDPFTNASSAKSFGFSNSRTMDLSDPSVPVGTAQQLIQTERYDSGGNSAEMSFALDLADGDYQVDLYFAEIFSGTQGSNQRVFDVLIEDAVVLNDYDVFADVGGYTAVVKSFNATVTDGTLDIELQREIENPAIKGILVRTVDVDPPDPIAPILDLNGGDAGTNATVTFTADEGPVAVAETDAVLADADSGTLASLTVTLDTTPDGNDESLDADVAGTGIVKSYSNGVLALTGVASVADYQAVLRSVNYNNTAVTPDTTPRAVSFVANDGTLDSNLANATVNIELPAPDPIAPVIDLNGNAADTGFTATHVIADGPTAVTDPAATLVDADSATLESLTVTITNFKSTGEFLDADVAGTGISKQMFNGNGIFRLTGTASVADYQAVLRTITYENINPSPDLTTRQLEFVANDGTLDSLAATTTLTLEQPVVDPVAPVVDLNGPEPGTGHTAAFVAGGGPVSVADLDATISDADTATLQRVTVTITNLQDAGDEVLTADTTGTSILSTYQSNGVLTLSGFASVGDYRDVLRSVTYNNTAATPATANRLIEVVANDGELDSNVASSTVTVEIPIPDPVAPVIDLNGGDAGTDAAATFTAGDGPVTVAEADASLIDADFAFLESLTVTLDATPDGIDESLDADVAGTGIVKSYSNGVLALTGVASDADYQAVLRSVTYNNTAVTPDTTPRTVSFVANDGTLDSNVANAVIEIDTPTTGPGEILFAVNAGGSAFTDANGVEWVADGPFTNASAAKSFGFTTTQTIDLSDPSIPAGTAQQLLQSERWDAPGNVEMAFDFDVANGDYQVDVYFADIFSGTQSVGARVFDVQLEDAVVLDDYDVFADVGGFTGVVKTFDVNVTDGELNLTFLHETENPAVKAILIRTEGGVTPDPIAPVLDLDATAAGTGSTAAFEALGGPVNITADDAVLSDADSATLESLTVFLADTPDGAAERLDADVTGTGISKAFAGGILSLTGTASVADYQSVLRSLTYDNLNGLPAGSTRSINVVANDGGLDSNTAVATVSLTTPAAPELDLDGSSPDTFFVSTFNPGQGPINITGADATLTDADSATLESLTVLFNSRPDGADEIVDADVTGTTITKSLEAGQFTLTGTASVADYQAVLRTLTYDNLATNPTGTSRLFDLVASDGTAAPVSNTATASVTIAEVVQPQPGTLVADVQTIDFNNAQTGVVERFVVTLTHPGAAIDDPVTVTGTDFGGINQADFGDLFTEQYGESVTLQPGDSIEVTFFALPQTTGTKNASVFIVQDGANTLILNLEANAIDPVAVGFGTGTLTGANAATPTTLQWGPDDRLYVGTLDGLIHAYTIERNGPNDYVVTDTQTITLVQDIPNYDDDGVLDPTVDTRLITGLTVAGTPSDPILYVTSSDPRLTNDGGEDIDTNSGIVSKLTQNGDGSWDKVDLVRGLPRSTVDHAPHAVQLLEESNTLLVAVGGLTNAGAPGEFFGNLPEYALSAGIVSLDLDAIEALPTQTDANGQQFKYNLPTLDDEDRPTNNDANDPFGGNEGKNQAVLEENGPVDIFASGLRNPYDFVISQYGQIYSTDNGPNASIGDVPLLDENGQPTNEPNQGGSSAKDALHLVSQGSYSGHPNPTRANDNNTFNDTNPQSPVYNGYTEPGDYQENGTDGALALFDTSTNGITEYTATGFEGALNGDLLTVTIDGKITRLKLSPDGTSVIDREILFNNAGAYPLDITAVGDDHPFGGTIWVADLFAGPGETIRFFEPEAGSGQGTPEDLDGDGYLNQDEIDNGTNPNSSGDTPADNDQDFVSDLNDPDDDNDTLADLTDPFQVDDTNGNGVNAPFALTFDNDDLNRGGLLDLGFTGVMTNGTTDYLDQFDFANLTAGSAAGVLTIDAVGPGTALGSANTQENAFQFGLNLNTASQPVTIQTKIDSVFDNATPSAGQRAGLYFGTGDQDNYIAIFVEGDGTINTVTEIDGVPTFGTGDVVGDNFTNLNLYLTVDPATQTVQAAYSYGNGAIVELAGTTGFPVSWLEADTAPAVGVIATSGDSGEAYSVTYDFIRVEPAGGSDGQAPFNNTPNQVGQRVEAEHFDLGGEGVAYLDLSAANEGGSNLRPGEAVDLEPTNDAGGGVNVGWIEAGEYLEYTFDIEEAGTYSADFRVALASGSGSTFHLEINGQNISGPINLPVTGGWQTWQTVTANNLELEEGPVVLRVAFDTASTGRFVGNLNWLELYPSDPTANPGLDLGDSPEFNWVDAPPIPGSDRFEGMSITVDNIVYAFGGFSDGLGEKLVDVWAYSIETNQWSARTSMPAVVNHLNAVYDEATGLAWFVGGFKGEFPGQATDEVWIYDVANDSWSAGPDLPEVRSSGNLAQVGRTLHYIGGFPDRTSDAALTHYTLDLDNPSAGWSLLGVQSPASRGHASTAVLGTDIYILGGQIAHDTNTTDQDDVYKFDTVTQTWSQVADLPFGWSHAEPSTFTANGRIFMAGGRSNVTGRGQIDDFYMYDPGVDAWVQLPDLPATLLGPIFTVVDDPDGGGECPGPSCGCSSCQALFGTTGAFNGLDGTSNSFAADFDDVWSSLPSLPAELGEIAAGVIDNTLYVVGDGDDGTYAYDFTTGQWSSGLAQRPVPAKDQLAEVVDGKLYVFGGIDYAGGRSTFNDTQIYDPAADTWTTGTDVPINIFAAQTTVIDGKIYLSGGVDNSDQTTNATYVYDPADGPGGSWTQLANAPLFRNSAAVGTDGEKMYIFGGRFGGDAPGNGFTSVMIYDPATDTWESSEDPGSTLAELPQARGGIVNAPFIDGEFYVIGGETDNDPAANAVGLFDRVDIYNPVTNTWRQGAPMITARHGHYPVAHAGAIYIPGGGVVKGASNSDVFDVYYPNLI